MKTDSLLLGLLPLIIVALAISPPVGAQQPDTAQVTVSPQVFFDHLYIVVDEETYTAIKESDFISDVFCMFSEDTVSSEDETWAGAYMHGEQTYVEVFGPGGFEGAEEGTIGLGFSTARAGDIDVVCERYREHFGEGIETDLMHFESDTLKFPWFYALASDSGDARPVSSWVMEYHPMHLQFLGVIPDSTGAISRLSYITAMNSFLAKEAGLSSPRSLFRGITAISLTMTQSELDRLSAELKAMSFAVNTEEDRTIFWGPELAISCAVTNNPGYRIRSLDFSLSRKPKNELAVQLGPTSVLTISTDGTGRWTFAGDQ